MFSRCEGNSQPGREVQVGKAWCVQSFGFNF